MTNREHDVLKSKKLFIIDGNSYLHRAYHALPPLTTSFGEQINAVYGFLRMILKLLKNNKPDFFVVCFDTPAPTFRHKEYSAYKQNRKETEESLKNQIPLAREAVNALNLKYLEKDGFEADDLIATLSKKISSLGIDVVIVTGDKDCLQLVDDSIKVLDENKDIFYDSEKVKEKFGVYPDKISDLFIMTGDSTDNVPGIKGVGEKTATKLIQQFGSLDNILKNIDSLPASVKIKFTEGLESLPLTRRLIELKYDVPLDTNINDLAVSGMEPVKLINFLRKIEATGLAKDLIPVEKSEEKCAILTEKEAFDEFTGRLSKARHISIDAETDEQSQFNSRLTGISISSGTDETVYIPLAHNYLGCPVQLEKESTLKKLKPCFENKDIKKSGQNIKNTLVLLGKENVSVSGIEFDPLIASYCINPAKIHNLKELALEYLGKRILTAEEVVQKVKGKQAQLMAETTVEKVSEYGCAKAGITFKLKPIMETVLREKKLDRLFSEIEMPLAEILAEMEKTGILVDDKYLRKLDEEFAKAISELEREIYGIAGEEFNLNSPKQLAVILFEKLKLSPKKRTKTGFSTNEEVLISLSAIHPLPAKLIKFRELQKLKSTYIDALLELKDPQTNRVHTSFNQLVTTTGRLSSSNPNLQNIPIKSEIGQQIRKAFIPEKGKIFISADYSQIDLRVLAHISGDRALVDAFNKNMDIHTATACQIMNLAPDKVDTNARRIAKTINFGIIYGMSSYGLSRQLNITPEEAQKHIDDYFKKYTGVKKWIDEIIQFARDRGYVATLLNRIRYITEINSKNNQIRSFAERTAVNTPIQGTSADIIKVAMLKIHKMLSGNIKTKMLLQVHDELLFEVPENEAETVVPFIKKEMEDAIHLSVPMVVDIKTGSNWAELKEFKVISSELGAG